ncbi:MAG: transglycosylase SLT domain-containing protein [Bdellovibrionales bacterium]|nr:transglycosylase SLT domain-containing protein [Bdellovibrionales bacterium]
MKTLLPKCLIMLGLITLFQGCSTTKTLSKKRSNPYEKFGNFDRVVIPNEVTYIGQMIETVQPELDAESKDRIATNISDAIKKHKVEPQIIIALIDTESNFKYDKISSTGDLSLAQINVDVWNTEFKRMKEPLIDKEKLVSQDQAYAMEMMAKILHTLKSRYSKKDRRWYARYHSNTSKYKLNYLRKIEVRMKMLSKLHETNSAQNTIALTEPPTGSRKNTP